MLKQIKYLSKIQLCNIWGFNQIKYGKDKKQRNRLLLLLVTIVFLGLFMAVYSGFITFALALIGIGELALVFMLAAVSLLILFFSLYKAGSILFDLGTYDMLISLPLSPAAIVVSRFITMYVRDLGFSLVIMLPAGVVYGVMARPGLSFYFLLLIGIFLLPLLPITIATALGAVITAISSRMKHKNLVTVVLTMLLSVGIIVFSMTFSYGGMDAAGEFTITEDMLKEVGSLAGTQIYGIYPPTRLFAAGVTGNLAAFLGFAATSILPFLATVGLVQWKFVAICSALHSKSTGGNYQMKELSASSPTAALYKRELKRYFASSLYVMNTMIGYVLMVVLAVTVFLTGAEKLEEILQIPGIIARGMPFLLAFMCSISSTTNSTISMEGKQWWLVKSLPVSTRQVFNSKMLVNLTVALPCYVIAVVLLLFAMDVSLLQAIWQIVIPLLYILLVSVMGITLNCKLPVFDWDTEAAVVKQSGAMLFALLIGMVSVLIPMILVFAVQEPFSNIIMVITAAAVLIATLILYRNNNKIDLRDIE